MKTIEKLLMENTKALLELKEKQIKELKEQIEIMDKIIQRNKDFINNL